jgi:hypothetical protein
MVGALCWLACSSGDSDQSTSTSTASSSVSAGGGGQGGSPASSSASGASGSVGGAGGATTSAAGGAGGSGGNSGVSCSWSDNNPCPSGQYCDAPGCGQGTCELIGSATMSPKNAVCGCDGINYWSAELAASQAMSVKGSGVCAMQKFCGGFAALKCPDPNKQHCVYDVINNTGCFTADVGGWCWSLPAMCPAMGTNKYQRCGQNSCDTECDAMKSGQKYYFDVNCKN